MSNPLEHPFVLFAAENARGGSLREVFINWLARGRESLLRDNAECAAVIEAAVAAYGEATRAAGTSGGERR